MLTVGSGTKWLTIRFSPPESVSLTIVRAYTELTTLERINIKDLIKLVINQVRHDVTFVLPHYRIVPEIPAKGVCEQVSYLKNGHDDDDLEWIRCYNRTAPLSYGQADIVREIIRIKAEEIKHNLTFIKC